MTDIAIFDQSPFKNLNLGGGPTDAASNVDAGAGPKPDLTFLIPRKGPSIGGVQLSASMSETHSYSARISRNPVEDGSVVSDHRILEPVKLSMHAIITEAPVDLLEIALSTREISGNPNDPAIGQKREKPLDTFNRLLQFHEDHILFTVITGIRVFKDMVFTSLQVQRDRKTGQIIAFSAEMEQVVIVSTQLIPADIKPKAAPTTDAGNKAKDAAPEMVCDPVPRSLVPHIYDAASNAIVSFFGGSPEGVAMNCHPKVLPKPL